MHLKENSRLRVDLVTLEMNRNVNVFLYSISAIMFTTGLAYSSVPLYKLFCSATGFGGTPKIALSTEDSIDPVNRNIKIRFNSDVSKKLQWKFYPCQKSLIVRPGESALAFYRAENYSKEEIIGMSTYSVIPAKAAPYFNKVQCFCFEEQLLSAGESVDMPVLFFIDSEFNKDSNMNDVKEITLSYTFFKARK